MTEHGEGVVHPEDVDHPEPPAKERAATWVADKCATVEFAVVNIIVVIAWYFLGIEEFPFSFLTLVLSVEAILLTVFVLVQNRLESEMQRREIEADLKNDAIAADESQKVHETLARIEKMLGTVPGHAKE